VIHPNDADGSGVVSGVARLLRRSGKRDAPVECTCTEGQLLRLTLLVAEARLAAERDRRSTLEHLLMEEVGQELAGISLLLTGLQVRSRSPRELESDLREIGELLAAAIGHCRPPRAIDGDY
jgi:hypothetical protein